MSSKFKSTILIKSTFVLVF